MNLYNKKPGSQPKKQPVPPAVTAQRAGLHPHGKIVQGLMGVNKKKQ